MPIKNRINHSLHFTDSCQDRLTSTTDYQGESVQKSIAATRKAVSRCLLLLVAIIRTSSQAWATANPQKSGAAEVMTDVCRSRELKLVRPKLHHGRTYGLHPSLHEILFVNQADVTYRWQSHLHSVHIDNLAKISTLVSWQEFLIMQIVDSCGISCAVVMLSTSVNDHPPMF